MDVDAPMPRRRPFSNRVAFGRVARAVREGGPPAAPVRPAGRGGVAIDGDQGRVPAMTTTRTLARAAAGLVLALATLASATPVELRDGNGTRYQVNTAVNPLTNSSLASGALTNATYTQPTTVTEYYYFYTFFGGVSTATAKYQVNVPLRPAFTGFNGLLVTSAGGVAFPQPLVYNPGEALAGADCPDSSGTNKELLFPTQSFPAAQLSITRKVFVPSNKGFLRWLNVVTNEASEARQVGIALRGMVASQNATKIVATSNGGVLNAQTLWFTSAQSVPQGQRSLQPRIGYVVQNAGAATPASTVATNGAGQIVFTFAPTIPAGGTAIIMTFVTVQGSANQAKTTASNLVATPIPSDAINCMSELELSQVVNFPKLTPPTLSSAQVKLNFKKSGQDTAVWKGKVTIGAGASLAGLPVTVDLGGVAQTFTLKKNGSANNGDGNKFDLQATLKHGVTKAGTVKFSFNLKGDLQTAYAAYGLTNATASNVPVTLPLTISVGNVGSYGVDQPFTWKATAGKSGTAKAS
jgi:hypothetical protein